MTRLTDRLSNHPSHSRIAELRVALDGLSEDVKAAAERDCQGVLARAEKACEYIEGALKLADPELTALNTLEQLGGSLSNAANTVPQLSSNPAVIVTVDQYIEDALAAAGLLLMSTPVMGRRAGAATRTFNTSLKATVEEVAAQANQLRDDLVELDARRAEADAVAVAAADDRHATLVSQIDALTGRVDTEQQRLDNLVPTFEGQFSEAQVARESSFQELRDQLTESGKETVDSLNESATTTANDLKSEADEVLKAVQDVKAEVETLYGVIADTSTTGAFRDEAKAQRAAADKWRSVAVGFGVVAALIAVASVVVAVLSPDEASTAGAIVAKVTAALVAAGIAAYAGRQSGRHREREEEAKRLELELVAFPPFIASLDEGQRREVRQQFADRAFRGRPVESGRRHLFQKDDNFGVGTPHLVEAIAAVVKRDLEAK